MLTKYFLNNFNIYKTCTKHFASVLKNPEHEVLKFPSYCMSICTFNILAPLYYSVERDSYMLWAKRQKQVVDFIKTIPAHFICLQEYWFNSEFMKLYKDNLAHQFYIYSLKRPRSKKKTNTPKVSNTNKSNISTDGLAILINKERLSNFKILNKIDLDFNLLYGDRIAIILHIKTVAPSVTATLRTDEVKAKSLKYECESDNYANKKEMEFILAVTHLTYSTNALSPQPNYLKDLQLLQVEKILSTISNYISKNNLNGISTFLAGDFNCENTKSNPNMNVHKYITTSFPGAISSFDAVNNRSICVSHRTHNNKFLGVDYIYMIPSFNTDNCAENIHHFPSFTPIFSKLLPLEYSDQSWPDIDKWPLSDHRPLLSVFRSECE